MKATFEKQKFNKKAISSDDYRIMFNQLGFNPSRIEICYTNGLSIYATINVNVLNESEMYADCFVYDGKATLKVRISDHFSNLERICGGVSGNTLSLNAFKYLVNNNTINQQTEPK